MIPINVTGRLFDLMPYRASMTIRLRQQMFAIAVLATPSVAEPFHGSRPYDGPPDDFGAFAGPVIFVSDETKQQDPDTAILALMAGKWGTLKIAGRDFWL